MSKKQVTHYAVTSDQVARPRGFYSQAVYAAPFLYISGLLPLDVNGVVVPGGIAEQTLQALSNVKAILESEGAGLSNLVQCTLYISNLEFWPEVNRIYEAFLKDVPVAPARAIVPVGQLHYGSLIEIQSVAYIPRSA